MNSAALTATILLCFLTFFLRRSNVIVVFLICVCWIPANPRLYLGALDLPVFRILLCMGLIRIVFFREKPTGPMNNLDRLIIALSTMTVITGTILTGSIEGFINRLGIVFDTILIYLFFRVYIQDPNDILRFSKIMAIVLLPVAVLMIYERVTLINFFSIFGGLDKHVSVNIVRPRAQGAFAHPILAGNVAAVSAPFFYFLSKSDVTKNKSFGIFGLFASLVIIVASNSSGPIITLMLCAIGIGMWSFRLNIKVIVWLGLFGILALHVYMNDPVWYLAARIDLAGGSTGWHRARLISSAIEHIGEWWFIGTEYTRHWMPTGVSWSPNHTDITNHYILIGIRGGLILVILFVMIIRQCFKYIGPMLKYL